MSQTYTGAEFEEALACDAFSGTVIRTGIVKRSDKPGTILFSSSGCQSNWHELPTEVIERAELVRIVECGGHTHPLLRITFETGDAKSRVVVGAILSALSDIDCHDTGLSRTICLALRDHATDPAGLLQALAPAFDQICQLCVENGDTLWN